MDNLTVAGSAASERDTGSDCGVSDSSHNSGDDCQVRTSVPTLLDKVSVKNPSICRECREYSVSKL